MLNVELAERILEAEHTQGQDNRSNSNQRILSIERAERILV